MEVGDRFCPICGKVKEKMCLSFGNFYVYLECECEKAERQKKEQEEKEYALCAAHRLRNKSSRLAPIYCNASFDTMIVDENNKKSVKAGEYILGQLLSDTTNESKNSLVLQGTRGSGKTFIASAVINDFNRKYPVSEARLREILRERNNCFAEKDYTPLRSPCKFITEMELYALFYDNFNYSKTDNPLDEFKKARKLLVIDDVGSSGFDSSRLSALYHNVIDYRHSNNLSTIITTNLNKKSLCTYIGDRAFDRLQACSYFLDLVSEKSRRN